MLSVIMTRSRWWQHFSSFITPLIMNRISNTTDWLKCSPKLWRYLHRVLQMTRDTPLAWSWFVAQSFFILDSSIHKNCFDFRCSSCAICHTPTFSHEKWHFDSQTSAKIISDEPLTVGERLSASIRSRVKPLLDFK